MSLTVIGSTDFRHEQRLFGIKQADRRQHMYVIGKTGTGKSTLLKHLIRQDMARGAGVGVIDPHGDLVRELLHFIPASRTHDVLYFDPQDQDFPIGFNILESVEPALRPLVASQVLSVFKHIWQDSWGPRLEYILANAIHTLLEVEGSTLLGIPRLLADSGFRMAVVEQLADPLLKSFWRSEYERYSANFQKEAIAPIQNKVGQFLTSTLIRHMVGQAKSKAVFGQVMDQGQILLANLSKGRIGEQACALLGSLLTSKLFLAALARSDSAEEERRDFYLYLDECHTIASPVLAAILSESRKYHLNLVLAHQYVAQLPQEIHQSVAGNVGTFIAFRLGWEDAAQLQDAFSPELSAQDLQNLGAHQIAARLAVDGVSTQPFTARTLPPLVPSLEQQKVAMILDASRQRYGTRREEVERQLEQWLLPPAPPLPVARPNRS